MKARMNSHLTDYAVIAICLALISAYLFWGVGLGLSFLRRLIERSAMKRSHVQAYQPEGPTRSATTTAFVPSNRIIRHNGKGTAFLVRAVRKEDITGGAGYFLPYNVKQIERGLFMVWEGAEPNHSAAKWIEVRGSYRFAPVPMDDEEETEVSFVEEIK